MRGRTGTSSACHTGVPGLRRSRSTDRAAGSHRRGASSHSEETRGDHREAGKENPASRRATRPELQELPPAAIFRSTMDSSQAPQAFHGEKTWRPARSRGQEPGAPPHRGSEGCHSSPPLGLREVREALPRGVRSSRSSSPASPGLGTSSQACRGRRASSSCPTLFLWPHHPRDSSPGDCWIELRSSARGDGTLPERCLSPEPAADRRGPRGPLGSTHRLGDRLQSGSGDRRGAGVSLSGGGGGGPGGAGEEPGRDWLEAMRQSPMALDRRHRSRSLLLDPSTPGRGRSLEAPWGEAPGDLHFGSLVGLPREGDPVSPDLLGPPHARFPETDRPRRTGGEDRTEGERDRLLDLPSLEGLQSRGHKPGDTPGVSPPGENGFQAGHGGRGPPPWDQGGHLLPEPPRPRAGALDLYSGRRCRADEQSCGEGPAPRSSVEKELLRLRQRPRSAIRGANAHSRAEPPSPEEIGARLLDQVGRGSSTRQAGSLDPPCIGVTPAERLRLPIVSSARSPIETLMILSLRSFDSDPKSRMSEPSTPLTSAKDS